MAAESPDAASTTAHAASARWRDHNIARRHQVLDVALTLLDSNPAGREFTISDIAHAAGLADSVIYRQFNGRDELFAQMRTRVIDKFYASVAEQLENTSGPITELLSRTISAIAIFMQSHPSWVELARDGPPHNDPVGVDAWSCLRQRLARRAQEILDQIAIDSSVDPAVFRQIPAAAASMQHGLLRDWLTGPQPTRALNEVVAHLSDFTWHLVDGAARRAGLDVDPNLDVSEMVARFTLAASPRRGGTDT